MFSVQVPLSLAACILRGQGFCPDSNRTGSALKPNRIQKGAKTYRNDRHGWSGHSLREELWQRPDVWLQAKGEELSSGDKLPQDKSPQDHGAFAFGQLGMTTSGETPSWSRFEIEYFYLYVYFFLGNQLNFEGLRAVETLQRSSLSEATSLLFTSFCSGANKTPALPKNMLQSFAGRYCINLSSYCTNHHRGWPSCASGL